MTFGVTTLALAQGGPSSLDVARLSRGAGKVVVGRVIDVQPRFETNRFGDDLIVSHAVVEVTETLKGSAQSMVRVAVEGGTVGGLTLEVSDMPALAVGDEAVMFLDTPATGDATPHDRGHGIMKLDAQGRVQGNGPTLDDVRGQVRAALAQGGR
jgi:hypothetical protein